MDYLNRLRGLGVEERYLEMERAAWIMIAAQVPDLIDTVIAKKHEALDDPDMVKLYSLLRGALDWLGRRPAGRRSRRGRRPPGATDDSRRRGRRGG
ncbi:hypothetical protein ACFQ51_44045 [Streptomyces kaempferi]